MLSRNSNSSTKSKALQQFSAIVPIIYVLFLMFVCSGVLLFALSLAMYYLDISSAIASNVIYAIYGISAFFGGFLIGKIKKEKKFLWGILMGTLYFVLLLMVSLIMNGGIRDTVHMLIAALLCLAPGMAGGMLS